MVPAPRYGTDVPDVNGHPAAGPSPAGEPDAGPSRRKPRADALRNRARILQAAEAVFAANGAGVPIDEIARAAGLGVGTLYRHFPTKEALWEAIAETRLEQVVEDVRRRAAHDDPGTALFEVLADVVAQSEAKRDLFEALAGAGVDPKTRFEATFASLHEALAVLLRRAQEVGAIRRDVGVDDVLALISGACSACASEGFAEVSAARILAVVCDGLRPPG